MRAKRILICRKLLQLSTGNGARTGSSTRQVGFRKLGWWDMQPPDTRCLKMCCLQQCWSVGQVCSAWRVSHATHTHGPHACGVCACKICVHVYAGGGRSGRSAGGRGQSSSDAGMGPQGRGGSKGASRGGRSNPSASQTNAAGSRGRGAGSSTGRGTAGHGSSLNDYTRFPPPPSLATGTPGGKSAFRGRGGGQFGGRGRGRGFGRIGQHGGEQVSGLANQFVHVELERDGVWKVSGEMGGQIVMRNVLRLVSSVL